MTRQYPDEPAGPFPEPPQTITDGEGRTIHLRGVDGPAPTPPGVDRDLRDALVGMYLAFDPADRAQGVPPTGEDRIRRWLDTLLEGYDVVAWHEDRVVGHATLVPDDEGGCELAIFVVRSHQNAGVGTELLRTLLGHGAARGVDRVWLTVERWNRAAVALYERVGFETVSAENFDLEMAIRLA
ncbi:MAG: N-acetyltransferase family protein [Halobacteriaceae archaeon]